VSELVLENHAAYATELERVMELERSLQDALGICVNGRRYTVIKHYYLFLVTSSDSLCYVELS